MDKVTTWDLLRLALMGLALGFSILLWYIKHFVDTLRDAERESPNMRQTIARSPRIFAILCGVIGVFIATWLSASVARDAFQKGTMAIPLWSAGFWLLLMCLLAPVIGAVSIGLVALAQIGWLRGLFEACKWAIPVRSAKPLELANAKEVLPPVLNGRTVKEFTVNDSALANWAASLMWVRTNERGWRLGKGFVDVNRLVLRSIVDHCWKHALSDPHGPSIEGLEHDVAGYIQKALVQLDNVEAQILNRPLQLARAACALYAAEPMNRT